MNHGCVTLDEVFAAAAVRAASLVPETSGYLVLAIGDASSRLPLSLDERALMLTTEGNVTLSRRGEVVSPRVAGRALRDVLARLLAVSSGTMPGLAGAGRPREESERGVDAVIEEIEAALIPVNRAAARRALGRLARETLRAKEAGKLKPRAAQAPRQVAPKIVETAALPSAPATSAPATSAPIRERSPIPPPELVATPAPRTPSIEAALAPESAPADHDFAPLLEGFGESDAPSPSAAVAPLPSMIVAPIEPPARVLVEPLPRVVITEPRPAAASIDARPAPAPEPEAPAALTSEPVISATIETASEPLIAASIEPFVAAPIAAPIEPMSAPVIAASIEPIVAEPIAAPIEPASEPAIAEPIEPVIAEPIEPSISEPIAIEPPMEAPAPMPSPALADSAFDVAEPTPTVLGMAIEIDDAPTPIDVLPAVTFDAIAAAPEEEAAPLAPCMPVTLIDERASVEQSAISASDVASPALETDAGDLDSGSLPATSADETRAEAPLAAHAEPVSSAIEEHTATPIDEPVASPIEEQAVEAIEEQAAAPIEEQALEAIEEQAATPIDERVAAPIEERVASPIEERVASPSESPLPVVASEPVRKTPRPILSGPRLPPNQGAPTRSDDLLARFSCSSGEDTVMTATAVSLKKLAFEPTPPPPGVQRSATEARAFPSLPGMDRTLPSTSPPPVEAQSPLTTIPTPKLELRVRVSSPPPMLATAEPPASAQDEPHRALDETPITRLPSVAPRKTRPGISVAAAILAGTLAGLFTVARLRPDLVASLEERIGPALSGSPRAAGAPAAPLPGPAAPAPTTAAR